MENTCNYSDNWQPYIGEYDKFEYDIKLKDGRIIENCYPNGGMFNSISDEYDNEAFFESEVLEIRFSRCPRFGINDSVSKVSTVGNIFEVNGVKYRPIPQKPRPKMSSSMSKVLTMVQMFGAMDSYGVSRRELVLPIPMGSSLIEEYGKIERKESSLTRSQRDAVVRAFKNKYEKAE